MRIAVTRWGERVSPLFEAAAWLLIVETDLQGVCGRFEAGMDHLDSTARIRLLRGLHVDILICGAIERNTRRRLESAGLAVACDVCGFWEEALGACLKDQWKAKPFSAGLSPGGVLPDTENPKPGSKA
jgi:predicted Fe-Mo cluster-binding NifX family protein